MVTLEEEHRQHIIHSLETSQMNAVSLEEAGELFMVEQQEGAIYYRPSDKRVYNHLGEVLATEVE